MPDQAQQPEERLRSAILAEAGKEKARILGEARREADAILARGAEEASAARRERMECAAAEAARRGDLVMSTVSLEAGRMRAARIEEQLQSIRAEALRRLSAREGFPCREALVRLAADAAARMGGAGLVVKVSPADLAEFGAGLAGEIAGRAGLNPDGLRVEADPAVADGVIVRDAEGRRLWDNRFAARLERLWPEIRRRLAADTEFSDPATEGGVA